MIPDARIEERLLSEAVAARQRIVDVIALKYTHGSADAQTLSASAGSNLDQYAHDLLHRLIDAARGAWDDQAADWVRERYHDCLSALGMSLRDLILESGPRHAVAQALQQRMLEAELRLEHALDTIVSS
ncbi:MAG TPA: hypothetical protein VHI99_11985 [Vicinamibacterales bacterium]|jgi:hypothetical protein|nr:hypothetical protein [Vicinamibacterales bacterium]